MRFSTASAVALMLYAGFATLSTDARALPARQSLSIRDTDDTCGDCNARIAKQLGECGTQGATMCRVCVNAIAEETSACRVDCSNYAMKDHGDVEKKTCPKHFWSKR